MFDKGNMVLLCPDKSCKHASFCSCQPHGVHSDFRGCSLQCGPAGGAASPGPAAMHRAPPLLSHVSGRCLWPSFASVQPLISDTVCQSHFMLFVQSETQLFLLTWFIYLIILNPIGLIHPNVICTNAQCWPPI